MTVTDRTSVRSLDDPDVFVETPATIFDAVPPYPPRSEREAEFYHLADGEMLINLGPQHPSTHGVLRVVLKVDGERVVDLDPVLGYLHRGVEKICENGDWHHAISNCDPLEYVASMFSEAMPVLSAEKLLDLEVPRRAEYIRVLTWELNRIASHALFMGWLALDLGGLTPIMAKVPRLIRIPPGRAWIAIESPRGEYGCYAMSDGSDQPFRLRIHDPSFFNLQTVGLVMPGNLIADT